MSGAARDDGLPDGGLAALGLHRHWWAACTTGQLRTDPLGRVVHGVPLVLFRDPAGRAVALEDRCAHRNVPLSLGRCQGGELTCRYHGWRYDAGGTCRHVPGLAAGEGHRDVTVRSFPVQERDGLVWVVPSTSPPARPAPPELAHVDTPGTTTVRHDDTLPGSLRAAVENALDVPHTGFLHRGLFRSGAARHRLEVTVRTGSDRVEAHYRGEPRPDGVVGRLLAPQGGEVVHVDRFLAPGITEVDYALGPHRVVVTTAFTPVDAATTRLHAAVTFAGPLPAQLVRVAVRPVATRILRQDAWILGHQHRNVERFGGERFTSTPIDVLGDDIATLLARLAGPDDAVPHPGDQAPPRERTLSLYA